MISNLLIAAVFFLAFISAAIDTHAATLTVTKTADTADGVCDSDCSLREAVTSVGRDNTIVFSPLFNTPQTITLTNGQLAIIQNMMIDGPGAGLLTINGNNASRIFRISGGVNVTLEGMKLTNGRAFEGNDPFGGALYVVQSSLSLTNMVISNNAAPTDIYGLGGGIGLEAGTLTVQNSSITHNVGGGIYASSSNINITGSSVSFNQDQGVTGDGASSFMSVVDSNVSNNTGTAIGNSSGFTMVIRCTVRYNRGGVGVNSVPSSLTIADSVISHNEPGGGLGFTGTIAMIRNTVIDNNFANGIGRRGGGIFNTGTMYILNSSITNNKAFEAAGGIYAASGHLYLTNSTVSGNLADNGSGNCNCPGGGMYNGGIFGGIVELTNSTITNNRAAGVGGGIYHDNSGKVIIRNSIIAANLSFTNQVDVSGNFQSQGFNLVGNTTGSLGWAAADLVNVNGMLGPLGNNGGTTLTHALLPGSPAINAGNNKLAYDPFDDSLLAFDQRASGFVRIVSGTVDIGAYEANYSLVPVTLAGRVLVSPIARGVPRTVITLTDATGNIRYAQTNPFGYYRFLNVPSGVTYTIKISNKSHLFDSPQFITADRDRNDLNFVAQ